jgi:hypothetical protein
MKQHITVEQLFELQDYTLAEVMDEEFQNAVRDINCNPYMSDTEKDNLIEVLAEQVTIGKMIEILSSKYDVVDYSDNREFGMGYTVSCITFDSYDWCDDEHREYIANELCDALWEAVKEVLKGE